MKTRLLAVLAVTCLVAGCTRKNGASLEPIGFCAYPDSGDSCAPGATCDRVLTGIDGFYLGNHTLGYYVEFKNQLDDNASADTGGKNTNDATVTGSSMSYSVDVSHSASTPAFTLPSDSAGTIEMTVPAGGTATPYLEIIPPSTLLRLRSQIAAGDSVLLAIDVKAKARLGDGSTFEVALKRYWVQVFNAAWPGYTCPKSGDEWTKYCGILGDGAATFKCETPGTPATYAIGGTVTGLTAGGGTVTIRCTVDGLQTLLPVMSADGNYSCGTATDGASWAIDILVDSVTTCLFDTNSAKNISGTISGGAASESVTCK